MVGICIAAGQLRCSTTVVWWTGSEGCEPLHGSTGSMPTELVPYMAAVWAGAGLLVAVYLVSQGLSLHCFNPLVTANMVGFEAVVLSPFPMPPFKNPHRLFRSTCCPAAYMAHLPLTGLHHHCFLLLGPAGHMGAVTRYMGEGYHLNICWYPSQC